MCGVKRKAEDEGDSERASDDKPRGASMNVDQVTVELAEEWIAEIKTEVGRKFERMRRHRRGVQKGLGMM